MNKMERRTGQKEDIWFKFEILKATYMACKTDDIYEVNFNKTRYFLSFENGTLAISSCISGSIPDDTSLPFLESKLGEVSNCFSKPSSKNTEQIFFHMFWKGFDIDKV